MAELLIGVIIGLLCGVSIGIWLNGMANKFIPNKTIGIPNSNPTSTTTEQKLVPAFMPNQVPDGYRKNKREEFFNK